MDLTKRRNLNRGYMKLRVWCDAVELFKFTHLSISEVTKLDIKLRSQILDAAQSISANIAEGYCRRSLREYLQFLYIALGSSGEALTRMMDIKETGQLCDESFEKFDELHYSMENKLLALVKSLQTKMKNEGWNEDLKMAQRSLQTPPPSLPGPH